MKKIVCLCLGVVAAATMLTACGGKFTCGLCQQEKSGKKYDTEVLGQKVEICKDCHKGLEEAKDALSDLL